MKPAATDDYDTLRKLAAHLLALSGEARHIEQIVGQIVTQRESAIGGTAVRDLQRIDYLSQSLQDVSRLVLALSDPEIDLKDRVSTLNLACTRALLDGGPPSQTQQSGAVDLF